MPLKTLPYYKDWPTLMRQYRFQNQPDNGFAKALEAFWQLRKDEVEQRLAALPRLQKLAQEMARSKALAAASPTAPKLFDEVAGLVAAKRKEIEAERKAFEAGGAHAVDVQLIVVDWNGRPLRDARGSVVFKSPGVPTVSQNSKLTGSSIDLNDVRLRPSGTLHVAVHPDSKAESIVGIADYEFKPGAKAVLKFKAVQHAEQYRVRARTLDEVSRKLGFKGSAGVDWKVVKIGGEVAGEQLDREAFEQEVEWHVKAGLPTFLDFKQL